MAANPVLARLEAAGLRLRENAGRIVARPREALTDELRELIRTNKAMLLEALSATAATQAEGHAEPVALVALVALPAEVDEERRQRVLAMLEANPGVRYACYADDTDRDPVRMAVAIRGVGTCEVEIPKAKYDGAKLLELIAGKAGGACPF